MNEHPNFEPLGHGELTSRLFTAIELHDAGVNLMRQNIIRRFPDTDEAGIRHLVIEWLQTRPGATNGDSIGQPTNLKLDS